MIKFNLTVSKSIEGNSIGTVQQKTKHLIEALSVIQAKCGTNNVKLFKIKNLMLDLIHNREVIDKLVTCKITDPIDWNWYSQLKYSVEKNSN